MGEPPLTYLTRFGIARGAAAPELPERTVGPDAYDVGRTSEFPFNRASTRYGGDAPAATVAASLKRRQTPAG